MKNKDLGTAILTTIAMMIGFVIYDMLFNEEIDWGRIVFVGLFVTVVIFLLRKIKGNKK